MRVSGHVDSVAGALVAAKEVKPDAALVDVMLPDGDGVALARQLAALPWTPRVLLTSSSADAASRAEIARSGAVGFVPKDELPNAPLGRLLGDDTLDPR
jgi:DNA-binding NarL/FixJ family response regulator